jgi:hypothetical protein
MPLNSKRRQEIAWMIPEGVIVTRQELLKNRLSRHAIDNLVKSGQLQSRAQGVYTKPGSSLTWEGVVYSLQNMFSDFVVGGLTAMEVQGFAHYLPFAERKTVHLYSNRPLPKWLKAVMPDVNFIRHGQKELFDTQTISNDFLREFVDAYHWKPGAFEFKLSLPEKSILEVLADVPKTTSFEHADQLMQGLTSLSPYKVQRLLESCRNVKVKRLFLWLAGRHDYKWFHKLNLEKIDLGSGNRVLSKGGKLDPKYKITVPSSL